MLQDAENQDWSAFYSYGIELEECLLFVQWTTIYKIIAIMNTTTIIVIVIDTIIAFLLDMLTDKSYDLIDLVAAMLDLTNLDDW